MTVNDLVTLGEDAKSLIERCESVTELHRIAIIQLAAVILGNGGPVNWRTRNEDLSVAIRNSWVWFHWDNDEIALSGPHGAITTLEQVSQVVKERQPDAAT